MKNQKITKLIKEVLTQPKHECHCGGDCCSNKAPILNESKKYEYPISPLMRYYIDAKKPLIESIFAADSVKFSGLLKEAKILTEKGIIKLSEADSKLLNEEQQYKIIYSIPKDWYNNNFTVVQQTLLAWKIEKIITKYEILSNDRDDKNDNYVIKIESNYDKEKLQSILNGKSTRAEKISINESIDNKPSEFKIIYGDEEVVSTQSFPTKQEAEEFAEAYSWIDNVEVYKDDDYRFIDKTMYFNPDDKQNYTSYDIKSEMEELSENSTEKQYKIEGLLVSNNSISTQNAILSDIRSLTGVTVVGNKEYIPRKPRPGYSYNYLSVKIDPYPYLKSGEFNIDTVQKIIDNINAIKGVRKFKSEAKLLNVGV